MDEKEIVEILDEIIPNPKCELNYKSNYELLVAVILSAQCSDKRVNIVTEELFKDYDTPFKMVKLSQEGLEEKIHSCGLYSNKAKNILSMSRQLIFEFDGQVPNDIEKLESLSGVGRKTANVVFAEAFKGDAIAVDTHVMRVSNRLGFVNSNDPLVVEAVLMDKFNKKDWSKLHLQLVHFGRYKCKARNPECLTCPFTSICKFYKNHNV